MVKEALEAISGKLGDFAGCNSRVDCCCPALVLFVFNEVNCVQIFNGACEDWRPGACADQEKR